MRLEARGRVLANPPRDQRRKGTLADGVTITFPRVPGGAKAGASRSTPGRPASGLRCPPAPLLEEEGDPGRGALSADVADPLRLDGTVAGSALTADDDPVDA